MNSDKKTLPILGGLVVDAPVADASTRPFPSHHGFFGWLRHLNWLFIFTVLLPTALATFYYTCVASDIYVSESSFIVQSVQDMTQTGTSLGSFLKSSTGGSSDDDTASVQVFMQSRDALKILEKDADLRRAYGAGTIDRLSRFDGLGLDNSFEALYRYYAKSYTKKIVTLLPSEASSAISVLEVRAFTADEANLINHKLLEIGERLVNTLNERLQKDLVQYAEQEVNKAGKNAEAAYIALADYRNSNSLVNPEQQSKQQLDLALALQTKRIDTLNQIAQLRVSTPNNPQIAALENFARSLESEIASELNKATGDTASLTNKASMYERLTFERDFLQKALGDAQSFLERSRSEAQRKQLYLKRIVEPNTPDTAIEPRRFMNVLTILIIGLVLWGITTLFMAGVREHQQ